MMTENPTLFHTGDKDSDDSIDGCECLHCRKLFTTSGGRIKMYHTKKYPQWFHEDCSGIDDYKKFKYMSNKMQRYTVYFICKLLYMFRVVPPPIIRSANNCIYSIWYLSYRYCYLPL